MLRNFTEVGDGLLMQAIAKHDSSVVTFSSADAVFKDSVYGGGKFSCQLNNVNRGATHAVKVVPKTVLIPNVFQNVSEDDNEIRLLLTGSETVVKKIKIDKGHYNIETLASALAAVGDGVQLSMQENGRFVVYLTLQTTVDSVQMTPRMAEMLGLSTNTYTVVDGEWRFLCDGSLPGLKNLSANQMPHLGTTPVVYVVARQVAMNNMVASDSKEYDVIATVSMNSTPYGSYASYVAPDVFVDDIDFRTTRSLTQVDFELLDYRYRVLTIDSRFPVIVQLKVYHVDTVKG